MFEFYGEWKITRKNTMQIEMRSYLLEFEMIYSFVELTNKIMINSKFIVVRITSHTKI